MKILKITNNNSNEIIKETLKVLKKYGLVVFPSDTVYGMLADATNIKAVRKLIEFKNRPPGKAISIFVHDFKMLYKQVETNNEQKKILNKILPGPFTVILNSKHKVIDLLESERKTLGVRIPKYQYITDLVKKFGRPVTATSANLSGHSPHYSIITLLAKLPEKKKKLIDLIVDAGKLSRNKPSTVVDLSTPEIKVLRHGDADFLIKKKFISKSVQDTKRIAGQIFKKIKSGGKPLAFIIEGELGSGKTVFVKGIGRILGINNIISPTFVVYYEYVLKYAKLIHIDLYNIEEKSEFNYLGIEKNLKKGNILCFEWGEKTAEIYELLKKKAKIIHIKIKYINEKEREIVCEF